MTGPIERPWWRGGGWGLMLGSFGLAVAAVAALALGAEDTRLLRLGIVAALWAALLGTFAAARMRREISSSAARADELRTVYQLELEREIAARREHELVVERELREQFEQRQRADLAALRAELQSLRGTLKNLLGGDVLVERVALRESTRLRPLPEHPRTVPATDAGSRARRSLTASEWPASEAPVSGARAESLPPVRHPPPPAEQPAGGGVREPRRFLDRPWSPAVAWTPSVDSARPPAGVGQGRLRRAEPDRPEPGAEPGTGLQRPGRHGGASAGAVSDHAPRGQPPASDGRHGRVSEPSWTSSSAESLSWESLGSHGRNAPPEPESNGPESGTQAQSVGAHRGGRSVRDLLAAYGENPTPRHRRRRRDD
ncbi:MAG: DUF6779 domain-containing protein [Pseudonocardiaceae bacterium]